MKLRGSAHGAEVRSIDAPRRYAGFKQLRPIGFGQVNVRVAILSELPGDLRPHLVAALPDSRAYGGVKVGGLGSEACVESRHGVAHDRANADRLQRLRPVRPSAARQVAE